ncbi:MAG: DNA sulfur modification protein DndE [Ardenticatenaceae bacterium]|nr:DNA sulfur modification protein DndE [Ardenticatenaceae bacterium]
MEKIRAMGFNRIYVGGEVDLRLRNLKARTGLTPNLLCRLGFCLSLAEQGIPDPQLYADGQAREFNRYTLTGQWDLFFFALLRERLVEDGLDPEVDLEAQFKAHLSRGVLLLYQRLKRLEDLADLIDDAQQGAGVCSFASEVDSA